MFLVKVIRNGGRYSTLVCPFGAVQVAVICLTLMLEISSASVSGGK
jgi:hypothetical protein